jgi:predicted permease
MTALLTLGVGIGLNVSLFTFFNVLALRSWDVRDPSSVVVPFANPVGSRGYLNAVPVAEFDDIRERTETLAGLVAWERGSARVYCAGDVESECAYVQMYGVSGNFFDLLGIGMAQGRGFRDDEGVWGAPAPVAVISHGFWQRVFAGDPSAVGRTVRVGVDRVPVTIVGVARRGFSGITNQLNTEFFVPQALIDQLDRPSRVQTPLERLTNLAGRLKPDVTRAQAEAELNTLDRQFRTGHALEGNGLVLAGTRPLEQPGQTDAFMATIASFGAALGLVLLLVCANVGNLQLARILARRRELAVRLSLGAGRRRVVRQLLTEAGVLSLAAAMLGFGLSWIVPRLVLRLGGEEAEQSASFVPDGTVFVFAIALGAATAVVFALAPALGTSRSSRPLVVSTRATTDRTGRRLRSLLLASQIALSLTLLTGAGLLTRGLMHVYSVDLGFDAHQTAFAYIGAPRGVGPGPARDAFWSRIDEALRAANAGPIAWSSHAAPMTDSCFCSAVRRPDEGET